MGELILCNRKETDVPYYLEQNMINIYSPGGIELVYFKPHGIS